LALKDYYQILNIPADAGPKAIKSAYRQMALKYHPDHNPDNPQAAEHFGRIREAYEVLSQPDLKKKYDEKYTPSQPDLGGSPRKAPKDTSSSSKKASVGNLRYNLYINLEDVISGCERSIRYIRTNKGQSETVQLNVSVPKGAYHFQRLKVSGYGDVTKASSGDLFVIVHLQTHPIFLRNQLDLRVNVPITYLDAVLGSSIEVPTLSGSTKIKLKAGEFDHIKHILKGHGLPDPKPHLRGDLHVYFFIEHPTQLTPSQRNALQNMQRSWPPGEMMRQYQSYLESHKKRG
jgi:DnaJ-class molecular chaperone